MKTFLLVTFLSVGFVALAGGEEDKCAFPTNKKILKLLEKSEDPNITKKEQYEALKEAQKIDEECVEVMMQLGIKSFKNNTERAENGGKADFTYAYQYFNDVISNCPQYHADPYYYLGVLNYSDKNMSEAVKYFNLFLNFKGGTGQSYAPDHKKKINDVKEILPEIEFNENFYKKEVPFKPELVDGVSSTGDEYLPMLSPDNEMIFYTRKFDKANVGDIKSNFTEEYTLSLRDDISQPFDRGSALPKPFNVGPNYGGSTISIDNKEIIICACKDEQVGMKPYKNCDLYSAHYQKYKDPDSGKERYKWSELINLGPNINTRDGWEAQPSLSADGKTLYFATYRLATEETLTDIFYSTRDDKGNWTAARSLGNVINTAGHDKSPFLHTDSKTLYFASEVGPGRLGAGGYDIFYSRQDEKGNWSKPVNLGHPINTKEDEHGLIVSTDGKMAYFDSGRLKGKGGKDIYRFELYPEARPEKVVIVKGDLKDALGNPVKDARVEVSYADDKKVEKAYIDTTDGKFVAVVRTDKPQDIVLTVKKEGHAFESKLINTKELDKPVVKKNDMTVTPIEKGKSYTINDILFATNSYDLTIKSKFVIDQFVDFLKENPKVKIEVQGHTDNEGDPQANLVLSDNRAKAVMDYITSKGITNDRLSSKGYGQAKPKLPNTSPENKAKNRRTEFYIVEM